MTEIEGGNLPKFSGDLSHWNRDVATLSGALAKPKGYEFTAIYPEVIGSLIDDEIVALGGLSCRLEEYYSNGEAYLRELLPQAAETIIDDMAVVSNGTAKVQRFEIDKTEVAAGESPRAFGWHTDGIVGREADVVLPTYVIASSCPTLYYEGPACFENRGNHLVLRQSALDFEGGQVVAAEPYDIVRLSGATVHTSPKVEQSTQRVFMRVVSEQVRNLAPEPVR